MKILNFIGRLFIWVVYFMITIEERQAYSHAKIRDQECHGVENDMFGSTFLMGKKLYGKEPQRDFITWKEYRKIHKF